MAAEDPQSAQISLQAIAAWAAIAVNLGWNFFNYRRTNQVRDSTILLDQFKSVRSSTDAALATLRECSANLKSLGVSAAGPSELVTLVGETHTKIQTGYNSLESALRTLDDSRFATGEDWASAASAPWDCFIDSIDRLYAPSKTRDQILAIADDARVKLDALLKAIHGKLDSEVQNHLPQKLSAIKFFKNRILRLK